MNETEILKTLIKEVLSKKKLTETQLRKIADNLFESVEYQDLCERICVEYEEVK